jgi:hypothetical protein
MGAMSDTIELPPDIARASSEVRSHYVRMVQDGQNPRFAEMCALRAPPGTRGTDRAFMQGRYAGEWLNGMPKKQAALLVQQAQAAGINTSGRFYMGGLADKRAHLDPEAWVDSAGDVLRVAKKRDLEVHGIVDYVPPQKGPPKEVDINPRILREHVREEMKANPKLKRGEAVEKVKDRIVPHWKRKK